VGLGDADNGAGRDGRIDCIVSDSLMAARVASGEAAAVMPLVPTVMDLLIASKLLLFHRPP